MNGPTIEVDYLQRVNFAATQNNVAILRSIKIGNPSAEPLADLRLELSTTPEFIRLKTWPIDHIPPEQSITIDERRVEFDMQVLGGLDEAEHGHLSFRLMRDEEVLKEENLDIELLARDQWGGLVDSEMGQLLAAFVAPNDPAIDALLSEASRILRQDDHSDALEGYQSGGWGRAYMLAAAAWSAMSNLSLTYVVPLPSFEQTGQKIRHPSRIVNGRKATCLDITLLMSALLEAMGLNSVVLLKEGHAFVGVWLVDKTFPHLRECDVVEVRKAEGLHELLLMETTMLTNTPAVPFDQATSEASRHIREEVETEFLEALDIARARAAGIRPLASHVPIDVSEPPAEVEMTPVLLPSGPPAWPDPVEESPTTPQGRIDRWQRKLLDLTLRNRLLNFVESRQTIPILCPDIAQLEDYLSEDREFRICSFEDADPTGDRDNELHRIEFGVDILQQFTLNGMEDGRLYVRLPRQDMKNRLTTLFRKAKSDMAEGGANTLYLAAGFLRWKRSTDDERTYLAPLVLLPMTLNRRNVREDFRLRLHEDDAHFNATLLEFLSQDFHLQIPQQLLGDLPTDDNGLDMPLIFHIMRDAIRDLPEFEVIDNQVVLSTFSFAKYLMWKDLRDRVESLRENRLVRHLIDTPELHYPGTGGDPIPDPSSMDQRFEPKDIFAPLNADSSQLAAVMAAADGHDAVIIGPPGTGKSQTIANMIAHCLARGKTVLFVAEKSVALDVVHRRLKEIGLADTCLELHSNKTDRRSVLRQLDAAWNRAVQANEQQWIKVTGDLREIRDYLNAYVEALHEPGSHGKTIFDAIGIAARAGENPPFPLSFGRSLDAHDQPGFDRLGDIAEKAARAFSIVEGVIGLESITKTDWSYAWWDKLLEDATKLSESATNLKALINTFTESLGQDQVESSFEKIKWLGNFADAIAGIAPVDYTEAPTEGFEKIRRDVDELEGTIKKTHAKHNSLVGKYDWNVIRRIQIDTLDSDWRKASASIWPVSWFGKRRVHKILQTYAKNTVVDPECDLPGLAMIADYLTSIEESSLASLCHFRGIETEISTLRSYIDHAARFQHTLGPVREMASDTVTFDQRIDSLLREGGSEQDAAQCAQQLVRVKAEFEEMHTRYGKTAGGTPEAQDLGDLVSEMARISNANPNDIINWTKWNEARYEAKLDGMMAFITALEQSQISSEPSDARIAFEQSYMFWWLPLALDNQPALSGFTQWEQMQRIEKFRDLDKEAQQLVIDQIHRVLTHDLPNREDVDAGAELGILRHQLGLQKPNMPIRQLIAEMPEHFTKLAPCVLMSPLSIAQYLPNDQSLFDMVIFDEASQITTWDAVGAIARGRQSIIVGDPKQLPPMNFFDRTTIEEDSDLEYYEQDLESILDEVQKTGLPTLHLNWHYRSRDESLIMFSNSHYYNDRLITFPSSDTNAWTVYLHKIDGIYSRGKSRTNAKEAAEIVKFMTERMINALDTAEDERDTFGVITFNRQQQELILNLLDEARRDSPELEWFFNEAREEPTIVKNLENIQGDERDVMLFSITFGKDHQDKMTMNFGALNRDGGERRLNVAVTRSRKEMHVFSSVDADEIDINRTRALGVRDLRQFLEYAEHGITALTGLHEGSQGDAESPFEEAVMAALRERGWDVHPQVGVSGYRIDLGIVHPDRPGAYLAGIECDGATYHRSPTARDRDRVREGVLRDRGWEIVRIWSTEWFRDAKTVCDRVDEKLRELLEQSNAQGGGEDPWHDEEGDEGTEPPPEQAG